MLWGGNGHGARRVTATELGNRGVGAPTSPRGRAWSRRVGASRPRGERGRSPATVTSPRGGDTSGKGHRRIRQRRRPSSCAAARSIQAWRQRCGGAWASTEERELQPDGGGGGKGGSSADESVRARGTNDCTGRVGGAQRTCRRRGRRGRFGCPAGVRFFCSRPLLFELGWNRGSAGVSLIRASWGVLIFSDLCGVAVDQRQRGPETDENVTIIIVAYAPVTAESDERRRRMRWRTPDGRSPGSATNQRAQRQTAHEK
jgi:hypothetical protein